MTFQFSFNTGLSVIITKHSGENNVNKYVLAEEEGNIVFNDALNTFYLWLYGVRHGRGPFR